VIAALSEWHEHHERVAIALDDVTALPAHAMLEAYSVLTRLPSGLAVAPALAATVLADRFPGPSLRLDDKDRSALVRTFADAGVFGGSSYDGLVALEAKAHGATLLTLDERAASTYRQLSVPFRLIA
jgi:PIN domain